MKAKDWFLKGSWKQQTIVCIVAVVVIMMLGAALAHGYSL